jgi:hypothetical protein
VKTAKLNVAFSLFIFTAWSARAQSTLFQNPNFESANPVSAGNPNYPDLVTAASALPYWSVYYGNVQQTDVSYNGVSTGATQVTLIGTGNPFYNAIDGAYSVLLQGIVPGSTASISQSGLIPAGTQSLLFEAQPGIGPLDVFVGNQAVSLSAVGSGPNYTLYGANISEWADDPEDITFSAEGGSDNNWLIDDISFSTIAVPEPNVFALTAIGGLFFGARKWFGRRRAL